MRSMRTALGMLSAVSLVALAVAPALAEGPAGFSTPAGAAAPILLLAQAEIDFGDDSSQWANDGECDDPRFTGEGAAEELVEVDRGRDATDCRTLFEAGSVTLAEDADPAASVDFGDDSSRWANDGECDDPRFTGQGMAQTLLEEDARRDATDCRTLFDAGSITLVENSAADGIDFGDDTSQWANDGECDDPRFTGQDMAGAPIEADLLRDATDCRNAYEAGTITLKGEGGEAGAPDGFEFGGDTSRWANDGECDDPRFFGTGTAKKLLSEDERGDATDCRLLFSSGEISIRPAYDPTHVEGAPYDAAGIEFGNNTSSYANDGECDDPRFEGPGTAVNLMEANEFRDANDCREAFEAGTITLVTR